MLLLGHEAQVEAHFGPFGDSANLDARQVYGLCRMYRRLENHFGRTPMALLGDVGHVESVWVCLVMVLVLVQDSCTICAKRTLGTKILLDAPNGTRR
jgi:hypothetical protein